MLTERDLRHTASRMGLGVGQTEHEYVMLCVLDALSHTPPLASTFCLKGGTALRLVYFADWRYSVDLDFSVLPDFPAGELQPLVKEWFAQVEATHGVEVSLADMHRANGAARMRGRFVGPLHHPARLLFDVTLDEPILLPPRRLPVVTTMFPGLRPTVQTYTLEELLAEKMRSILQRAKSRDYYDVWRLLAEKAAYFDHALARETLLLKCRHKGLTFSSLADFLVPARLAEAERYWERDLREQVAGLPEFSAVVATLRQLLQDFQDPTGLGPVGS